MQLLETILKQHRELNNWLNFRQKFLEAQLKTPALLVSAKFSSVTPKK